MTHCASHRLSLSLQASVDVQLVRSTVDAIDAVCIFVDYSPKRLAILTHYIEAHHAAADVGGGTRRAGSGAKRLKMFQRPKGGNCDIKVYVYEKCVLNT